MYFDASNRRVSVPAIRLATIFLVVAIAASSAIMARSIVAYERGHAPQEHLVHTY